MNRRVFHICWIISIVLFITILVLSQKQKNSLPEYPSVKTNNRNMTAVEMIEGTTATASGRVEKLTDQNMKSSTLPHFAINTSGCENWMPLCEKSCMKESQSTIPKHVHFISVGHPFTVVEWVAVLTAKKWVKPDRITIYTDGGQDSCWWRRVLPFIEHQLINIWPRKIRMNGFVLSKWTQITDFLRLSILYHYGGIYMDTDALTMRSFDDLLSNEVVLARNCKGTIGNGVLLAQKQSCFICKFAHCSCAQFIGDELTHSVHALAKYVNMSDAKQDGVNILTRENGFFPNCARHRAIYNMFNSDVSLQPQLSFSDVYSLHLFHTSKYLHQKTIYNASWTRESNSPVAQAIRRALPNEIISEEYYDVQSCTNKSFVL